VCAVQFVVQRDAQPPVALGGLRGARVIDEHGRIAAMPIEGK